MPLWVQTVLYQSIPWTGWMWIQARPHFLIEVRLWASLFSLHLFSDLLLVLLPNIALPLKLSADSLSLQHSSVYCNLVPTDPAAL